MPVFSRTICSIPRFTNLTTLATRSSPPMVPLLNASLLTSTPTSNPSLNPSPPMSRIQTTSLTWYDSYPHHLTPSWPLLMSHPYTPTSPTIMVSLPWNIHSIPYPTLTIYPYPQQFLLQHPSFPTIQWAELILQPFLHFTYITAHSPTLPLLHILHSSFSKPSFASPTSQPLHLIHLASRPCVILLTYNSCHV